MCVECLLCYAATAVCELGCGETGIEKECVRVQMGPHCSVRVCVQQAPKRGGSDGHSCWKKKRTVFVLFDTAWPMACVVLDPCGFPKAAAVLVVVKMVVSVSATRGNALRPHHARCLHCGW
jgi:hypothetical protein